MADSTTDLVQSLAESRAEIVQAVTQHLCSPLTGRYAMLERRETQRRIDLLYAHVIEAARTHVLTELTAYATELADDRFTEGYDLGTVQAAFNLLTDELWLTLVARLPAEDQVSALALITTVLGAGKDAVARRYLELAAQHSPPDLEALFDGTDTACLAR